MKKQKYDYTIAERVARYHERQKKKGLRQVRIWIPEDAVKKVRNYAKELREFCGR